MYRTRALGTGAIVDTLRSALLGTRCTPYISTHSPHPTPTTASANAHLQVIYVALSHLHESHTALDSIYIPDGRHKLTRSVGMQMSSSFITTRVPMYKSERPFVYVRKGDDQAATAMGWATGISTSRGSIFAALITSTWGVATCSLCARHSARKSVNICA